MNIETTIIVLGINVLIVTTYVYFAYKSHKRNLKTIQQYGKVIDNYLAELERWKKQTKICSKCNKVLD